MSVLVQTISLITKLWGPLSRAFSRSALYNIRYLTSPTVGDLNSSLSTGDLNSSLSTSDLVSSLFTGDLGLTSPQRRLHKCSVLQALATIKRESDGFGVKDVLIPESADGAEGSDCEEVEVAETIVLGFSNKFVDIHIHIAISNSSYEINIPSIWI
ncbi:unnamed protein product [Lactuca saligna]|uniref:Uncharacterized protein n=1 Tax=Lactuca saligna TaxID=75948 RepID=A0AA35VS82_LACSI|nr:unnamed protein product [Lactuca saligna]